jgi:hypothetical protein
LEGIFFSCPAAIRLVQVWVLNIWELMIHHAGDVVEPMPPETVLTQVEKSGNLFERLLAKHGPSSKQTGETRTMNVDLLRGDKRGELVMG